MVKAISVDFQHIQRIVGHSLIDMTIRFNLGEITYTPKQTIGNSRCTSRPQRYLLSTRLIRPHTEQVRRAKDDLSKIIDLIKTQDAE